MQTDLLEAACESFGLPGDPDATLAEARELLTLLDPSTSAGRAIPAEVRAVMLNAARQDLQALTFATQYAASIGGPSGRRRPTRRILATAAALLRRLHYLIALATRHGGNAVRYVVHAFERHITGRLARTQLLAITTLCAELRALVLRFGERALSSRPCLDDVPTQYLTFVTHALPDRAPPQCLSVASLSNSA